MTPMPTELQNDIARRLLKYKFQKEGVHLVPNDVGREIGNVARAVGVKENDLREFMEILIREMVNDVFGRAREVVSGQGCR